MVGFFSLGDLMTMVTQVVDIDLTCYLNTTPVEMFDWTRAKKKLVAAVRFELTTKGL